MVLYIKKYVKSISFGTKLSNVFYYKSTFITSKETDGINFDGNDTGIKANMMNKSC